MSAVDEPKTFEGVWWVPSNAGQKWIGTLTWTRKQSPDLNLRYRSVGEPAPPDDTESFQGLDEGGTPISVLRAGRSGSKRAGFLSSKKYSAGHILRGIHVESLQGFRANRVNFWLQHLGAWLNEEGFSSGRALDDAWSIEYRRPPDRCFQISSGTVLKICHSSEEVTSSRRRSIDCDIFFSVEKARPFDFLRAFKWLNALRSLIHFACLQRVHATAITFQNFKHSIAIGDATYPKDLELFNGAIHNRVGKDLHSFDFVFTFNDIEGRFSDLSAKWFRFCAEFHEALGCYMNTVYSTLSCEIKLICLTQALEAYHQRRFRPASGSEKSRFINRVKHLCANHEVQMSSVVGDIGRFATSVRDSRHYYTHHDPDIRQKGLVATGTPLTMMTYQLQYLFRLCVLSEFGLGADPNSVLHRQMPDRVTEYY